MTLGNAIKLIRTARKIKQRELAMELNVSANYLSMLEADRRVPSLQFLKKLASRLQVPAGLFLLWTEATKSSLRKKETEQVRELLVRIQTIYLADAVAEADARQ
jgi:transcriptional regulator with XRE-family HTH domain